MFGPNCSSLSRHLSTMRAFGKQSFIMDHDNLPNCYKQNEKARELCFTNQDLPISLKKLLFYFQGSEGAPGNPGNDGVRGEDGGKGPNGAQGARGIPGSNVSNPKSISSFVGVYRLYTCSTIVIVPCLSFSVYHFKVFY